MSQSLHPEDSLDPESEIALDPKPDEYTGDLKGLLVAVIEEHREELGLNRLTLKVRIDEHNPYRAVLVKVPVMTLSEVVKAVDEGVSSRIRDLVAFNDGYVEHEVEATYSGTGNSGVEDR